MDRVAGEMTMKYTNYTGIPLAVAVWLAADDGYDFVAEPNTISATSLMKPIRSIVLSQRTSLRQSVDIADLLPAKLGSSVHTAIEEAWQADRPSALDRLGVPKTTQQKICLNPDPKWGWDEDPDKICIYMEQRNTKELEINGVTWTVSGKFDVVIEGALQDVKTTKTFNWIKGSNDEKYRLQGSIYRWLNPDIITEDYIDILMIFTDWSDLKAKTDSRYPQKNILTRRLDLLSMEETESYIRSRLHEINRYVNSEQNDLPMCTPEELWMDPPKWAYYKNPKSLSRATKLFDSAAEAHLRCAQDGNTGIVIKRDQEPKYCRYCNARPVCTQAEDYINQGILKP
jgi:hypothetical protein